MKWVETNGRKPRSGDKPLLIKFRNGLESKVAYRADQIARWWHDGSDWDVIAVRRANAEASK
jgi:hypothetical protein